MIANLALRSLDHGFSGIGGNLAENFLSVKEMFS